MKIGIIRRDCFSERGAESYLKRLAQALATAGHATVLFTSQRCDGPGWPEIRIVEGESPRTFADALDSLQPLRDCDYLFSFERVWNCNCYRAGEGVHAARLQQWSTRKKPLWDRLDARHRNDAELLGLESEFFAPGSIQTISAPSQMVRDELVRYCNFPRERIQVIYGSLPREAGHPLPPETRIETRRQLGLEEGDFVIFCGGGLQPCEIESAIRGINSTNLSQPTLLVAGEDHRWAYPRSNRTRFLGKRDEAAHCLAAADLFLFPAVYHPFSSACLEALAAGLPVVTGCSNGFSEIIIPGVEGEILPDPSDSEAIARAIEAWSDPGKRRTAKPRLRDLAAKFSLESNLTATLALVNH